MLSVYLLAFGSLFLGMLSQCQSGSNQSINNQAIDTLNFTDAQGLKQGFWVDTSKYLVKHLSYVNDTLHGSFKHIWLDTKEVVTEGEYNMGRPAGIWREYDKGKVIYERSDIGINTSVTAYNSGNPYIPPKKSYVKSYHPQKGHLAWEGYILYTDSFEEDTHVKHGKWVYYDETGNVIKTEVYEGGQIVDE